MTNPAKNLKLEKLDNRSLSYQFDLESDIPWTELSQPGDYFSRPLLKRLGFDTERLVSDAVVMETCQWAMALATAKGFVRLEQDVVQFIEQGQAKVTPSKSSRLIVEEERKHIMMFQRLSEKLRADRPELGDVFDAAYQAPVSFTFLQTQAHRFSAEELQWLYWLTTLFFEEYTIYFYHSLTEELAAIQPVWLAAHRCHRREEAQHLLTDVAYMEQLPLSAKKKKQLTTLFAYNLQTNFTSFFTLDTWLNLQQKLFPGKDFLPKGIKLLDLGVYQDLLQHRHFRYTRYFLGPLLPGLENPADIELNANTVPNPSSLFTLQQPRDDTLISRFEAAIAGDGRIIFTGNEAGESHLDYEQLFADSECVLANLQARGIGVNDAIVLWLSSPEKMLPVFWACLLGGFTPVVLTPSVFIEKDQAEINRLRHVLENLEPATVVAEDHLVIRLSEVLNDNTSRHYRVIAASELETRDGFIARLKRPEPDDIAMVQFSSGSTGTPRGVSLTHKNLLAVTDAMLYHRGGNPDDVFFSWLPLSHDMGLIGFHLTPLVAAATQVLMPTQAFVKRPIEWFRALHQYRVTVTGGTSSALARILAKSTPEFVEQLDLSQLHSMIVGAETVSAEVLQRLVEVYTPAGLRSDAICPSYGLAEASLAVTMTPPGSGPRIARFSRLKMASGQAIPPESDEDTMELVELGVPVKNTRVRIVDDKAHVKSDCEVGTIQVSGPGVMCEYFGNKLDTAAALQQGWLNTHDRGFLKDGHLYFVGRDQEAFSLGGRNYFAHDVEAITAELLQLHPTDVVMLVNDFPGEGRSRLILFVADNAIADPDDEQSITNIHRQVLRRLGIEIDKVIRIRRKDIPRTTSGKLARDRLLQRYRDGHFDHAKCWQSPRLSTTQSGVSEVESSSTVVQPTAFWTDVKTNLRAVWAGVLGCRAVEIYEDDDFRMLGGDSLAAAEILVRLENASGRFYSTELLLEGTTLRKMTTYLEREGQAQLPAPSPAHRTQKQHGLAPIAVVGIGVNFPGADTLDAFWNLLAEGRNAFESVPSERRRDPVWGEMNPGPATADQRGAFVRDIEQFDPEPFNISDSEARYIEPQQRLFLEVCEAALDQAAVVGRKIGVFAASGDNEYALRYLADREKLARYSLLGSLKNMVAARVAQVFGFTGPVLAVDTACSSSATAVHLACESLRNGECSAALAGGAQLNLSSQVYSYFRHAGILSADGKCRPFDRDANGLVPGEGAGVVLLKTLEQAIEDGDHVYGLIRASSMNNDGGGLRGTGPSASGQRAVIETAYKKIDVNPASIDYVEAHATGTVVGDAVEIRSLDEAMGGQFGRVPVGSVKSNIGHTLAAAGVASLIKVLLSLEHEILPPTLGCTNPAERIGFDGTSLYPLTEATPWPKTGRAPRRAGINSFGLGGSNVHLVIEESTRDLEPSCDVSDEQLFCLYAAAGQARPVAETYRSSITETSASVAEICAAAVNRGNFMTAQKAFVVDSKHALVAELDKVFRGEINLSVGGKVVALVCPENGNSIIDATRSLLRSEPSFRATWLACDEHLNNLGLGLHAVLAGEQEIDSDCALSKLLAFSFSVSAARWLEQLGVSPAMVIGCGTGEFAAAQISGILSLEAALDLVSQKARLFEDVGQCDNVVPLSTTQAEQACDEFRMSLDKVDFGKAKLPFVSSVEGLGLECADADYWIEQVRSPARIELAFEYACAHGAQVFIELNAEDSFDGIVTGLDSSASYLSLFSQTPTENGSLQRNLARMINAGVPVVAGRSHLFAGMKRDALPTYPYQRRRHWIDTSKKTPVVAAESGPDRDYNAILDHRVNGVATAPIAWLMDEVLHMIGRESSETLELNRVVLAKSFTMPGDESRSLEICKVAGSEQEDWVARSTNSDGGDRIDHLWCNVRPRQGRVFSNIDLDGIAARCPVFVGADAVYDFLNRSGLKIGPGMRAVKSVQVGDNELIARLVSPATASTGHFADPCLLDGASQALAAFSYKLTATTESLYLGFSLESFRIYAPVHNNGVAYLRLREPIPDTSAPDTIRYDLILTSNDGEVLLIAEDFTARRVRGVTNNDVVALRQEPSDSKKVVSPDKLAFEIQRQPEIKIEEPGIFSVDSTQITETVTRVLARQLGLEPDVLPLQQQFATLGMDSLMAVIIVQELEDQLQVKLPSSLLFEVTTTVDLINSLDGKLRGQQK